MTLDSMPPPATGASSPRRPLPETPRPLTRWSPATAGRQSARRRPRATRSGCAPSRVRSRYPHQTVVVRLGRGRHRRAEDHVIIGRDRQHLDAVLVDGDEAAPRLRERNVDLSCLPEEFGEFFGGIRCADRLQILFEPTSAISAQKSDSHNSSMVRPTQPGVLCSTSVIACAPASTTVATSSVGDTVVEICCDTQGSEVDVTRTVQRRRHGVGILQIGAVHRRQAEVQTLDWTGRTHPAHRRKHLLFLGFGRGWALGFRPQDRITTGTGQPGHLHDLGDHRQSVRPIKRVTPREAAVRFVGRRRTRFRVGGCHKRIDRGLTVSMRAGRASITSRQDIVPTDIRRTNSSAGKWHRSIIAADPEIDDWVLRSVRRKYGDRDVMTYERVRAAHLNAVQAAMEDHIARLDWQRERIDRYRDQRLRMLLGFARERSSFHARRLELDTARATVADLASVPIMTKAEAQDCWDEIVTDSRAQPRTRGTHSGSTGMVFLHGGRLSGVQFGRLQRGAGRLRLGLAILRVRRMPGMADAGTSGAARASAGSDASGGAGGGRPTARQHAAVRCADRRGHGDGRHCGGSTVR